MRLLPERLNERTYTSMDKSAWGPGPWQTEPDKIQFKDKETGLPCLIVRNHMGALCGYVGVSEGHPAFGKSYHDAEELVPGDEYINVHGGLTFSGHCDEEGPEDASICHIPEPGEPDNVWWLGFDCLHAHDIAPRMEADNARRYKETGDPVWLPYAERTTNLLKEMNEPEDVLHDWTPVYRNQSYVRAEIASLARQLAALN